ncbi:MAG: hypothetical protein PHT54_04225 [Candidatus Nanoarchaeia archaeon]|nr:hypothetical protein [Candidatus Nanoarchaeia archaeon]
MGKTNKFIFWAPRILIILFILFLALFSLDIFGNNYNFWETVAGLFMHNLPSLALLVILIISWKHELVGAITFGFLGVLGIIGTIIAMLNTPEGSIFNPILIVTGIVTLLAGILFFVGWKERGRK